MDAQYLVSSCGVPKFSDVLSAAGDASKVCLVNKDLDVNVKFIRSSSLFPTHWNPLSSLWVPA
eukprot:COSAG01_NODE_3691_length_5790_cov_3.696011_3_plen_63_part_00